MYARKVPREGNTGCDFCLWILHMAVPGMNDNVIADTKTNPVAVGLDCTYNAIDPKKAHNCPRYETCLFLIIFTTFLISRTVKAVMREMVRKAKKYGESPHQYVNTPTCDKQDKEFGPR